MSKIKGGESAKLKIQQGQTGCQVKGVSGATNKAERVNVTRDGPFVGLFCLQA